MTPFRNDELLYNRGKKENKLLILGYEEEKNFIFGLTLYLFVCNAFEAMADVAQLVEPRFVVPVVVSSSLIVRPNTKKTFLRKCLFCIMAIVYLSNGR